MSKLCETGCFNPDNKVVSSITYQETTFPLPDEETRKRLINVMHNSKKAEAFAKALFDEIASDDEKMSSVGFYMAKAILHNNVEELLIAIVGWSSKSLLDIAETETIL